MSDRAILVPHHCLFIKQQPSSCGYPTTPSRVLAQVYVIPRMLIFLGCAALESFSAESVLA